MVTAALHVIHDVPAHQMTTRARLYLIVSSARHLILGASLLWQGDVYDRSPAFDSLFRIAPHWAWILSLMVGGAHLAYSSAVGSEAHARTALIMSAGISAMWATAFGLIALHGVASVLATVLFGALCLKDLIVCAQPLRSPFEPIVRLYTTAKHRG